MIGKEIGNHRILKELGRGGMGVVYKANQLSLGRLVAMKVLPQHLTSDQAFIKRFENEARAIAKLNHPNIIQIYDISHEEQLYYYTMEFIEGTPLDEIIYKEGFLPLDRATSIIIQVAKALQYAHSQGIVHRDIKPSNIMIDKTSRVKVTDFGLALQERTTRLTVEGGIVGTPEYMSPEQAAGETATPRSDIYSLGVVFYELLTGKVPFEAESPLMLINKIQNSEPEWPRSINPDIPAEVERIIQTMMAKNTRDRYGSCQEVIQDIRCFKAGQPILARPKRRYHIRAVVTALASLFAIATVVGAGLFIMRATGKSPAKTANQPSPEEGTKKGQGITIPGNMQTRPPEPAIEPKSVSESQPVPASITADNKRASAEQRIARIEKEISVLEDEMENIALQKPPPEKMWPDMIALKKGNSMRCEITSESPEKIRIRTDTVTAEIPRSEIEMVSHATPEEKENAKAVRAAEQKRLEDERRIKNALESLKKERARLAEILDGEESPKEPEPNAKSSLVPAVVPAPSRPATANTPTDTRRTGFAEVPLVEENWTPVHSCDRHAEILFDNEAITISSDSRIGKSTCTTTLSTISPIEGIPDTIEALVEAKRIMTPRIDRAVFSLAINFASGNSIEYCLFDSKNEPAAEVAQTDEGIRIKRPELLIPPNKTWIAVMLPLGADIAKIKGSERISSLALICKHVGPTAGTTMFRCKAIILNWK
ncbi:protein kinase [Candidatus Poribacteria bacterium]|nr:protein kinase [Candidatus Poribacteria bacterium]